MIHTISLRHGRTLIIVLLLAALLAPTFVAASSTGGWQVYTVAHTLVESPTFRVAPDGRGGLWVGHISGGRGINRAGGLVHIPAGGDGRRYTEEPFASCSSVSTTASIRSAGSS